MYSFDHTIINAVIHNAKIKAIKYSKTVMIRYNLVSTDHMMICREFKMTYKGFYIFFS